jgi:hypothetical protein
MSVTGWKRVALFAAMLAAPAAAEAAGGRIPIFRETMISQPGSYYVTRNFTAMSGMPAITIATPGVEIDLNGHTVGQGAQNVAVIEIALPTGAAGGPSIKIHSGQLDGGSFGISLQSPTVCLYGMLAPTFLVDVNDSQLHWAPTGLHLQGVSEIRTERVNVTGTFGTGIQVQDSAEWLGDSLIVGWPWGEGIHMMNVAAARLETRPSRTPS